MQSHLEPRQICERLPQQKAIRNRVGNVRVVVEDAAEQTLQALEAECPKRSGHGKIATRFAQVGRGVQVRYAVVRPDREILALEFENQAVHDVEGKVGVGAQRNEANDVAEGGDDAAQDWAASSRFHTA